MYVEKGMKFFWGVSIFSRINTPWYVLSAVTNKLESSSEQGNRKRWMQGFLPEKGPSIFSCLDLILWPNVCNIFGDDFVPHHLIFYEIF